MKTLWFVVNWGYGNHVFCMNKWNDSYLNIVIFRGIRGMSRFVVNWYIWRLCFSMNKWNDSPSFRGIRGTYKVQIPKVSQASGSVSHRFDQDWRQFVERQQNVRLQKTSLYAVPCFMNLQIVFVSSFSYIILFVS